MLFLFIKNILEHVKGQGNRILTLVKIPLTPSMTAQNG